MSTAADIPADKPKPRSCITFTRVLLGFITLGLLVWCLKTIHHVLQPKYQGKTAEEWFAAYTWTGKPIEEANAVPFEHLGTNGVWFLWGEYCRKDSKPTVWLMRIRDVFTKDLWAPSHEQDRHFRASAMVLKLGPMAEPLIPAILSRMTATDPDEATSMAYLLGNIQRRPEIVVPALQLSLRSTNWTSTQRIRTILALSQFGSHAKPALPMLQGWLADPAYTTNGANPYLATAILRINGPGPELALLTNNLVPGDYDKSMKYITLIDSAGTNASPAAPVLLQFAGTLTNETEIKTVRDTIHKIDPQGIYHKP